MMRLRKRLELLTKTSTIGARVLWRRYRHGPRQPSWDLRYEMMVEFFSGVLSGRSELSERRSSFDAMGARELGRGRVDVRSVTVGMRAAEWITPPGAATDSAILYLHGGAYALGSPSSHRVSMANLALATGLRLLVLDYRLAPEHPCPAAIEDGLAAYEWLLDNGLAPERVVIAGDSAGGGLSLSVTLGLRERGVALPAGLVLLSPWTDLSRDGELQREDTGLDYIGPKGIGKVARAYYGQLDPKDPRVSPAYGDFTGFPPMLIIAGGQEYLLADSERLAERARAHGVATVLHVEPEQVHVYPFFHPVHPAASVGIGRVAEFVRARLEG
ncbi:MAG: alpha/beta hydrolase [Myxococcota bacterium]